MKALCNPFFAYLILTVVGLLLTFGFDAYIQLTVLFICVNMLMAMSLNLVNGYTGQFSLGHAGFMAVGAYWAAYGTMNLKIFPEHLAILNYMLHTFLGGCVAALAGYLVGLPSLRLKGDYLAIVTLGFSEIIRVALLNMDFLGGARGISGVPGLPKIDLPLVGETRFFLSYQYAIIWLLICFFVIWRIVKSSHGRAFLSVREDEVAAESMGVNTTSTKIRAFVLSSFFAGVAGALYAHFTNFISPGAFTFVQSVNAIIMIVLGGMGSMSGAIVSAAFLTILPEALRPLQQWTGVDLRMVIYSLTLILVMILRPKGLFGENEITNVAADVWRKYVKRAA